ncbi:N-acyl-D-amino-acid deacylase family protein [Fodinicurvata sediminis]|uniref:N-acyl-D-amino-acid deacylase family protein n=1 Tax=Fodinicurvata sediminis TaxID=1121832 RepID=UPI0003B65F01|nr:D-aminoacylase [Fodinicurvata sediminis]
MNTHSTHHDLIIKDVRIFDGTGGEERHGDVAVKGDRISAIGSLERSSANAVIEGGGLALAPGFIDVHTHDDAQVLSQNPMASKITQGVTTVIVGNCGISLAPLQPDGPVPPPLNVIGDESIYQYPRFSDYIASLQNAPPAVNVAPLVGHSTLRVGAMDSLDRPATDKELDEMGASLQEALDAGAIGLSTGLYYPPARHAPATEVLHLLKLMAGTGGIYTTHMRNEDDHVEESLRESFETAASAGVPLVVSHHKCMGHKNHGLSTRTLKMFDEVRRHQTVGLDAYPYIAGSSSLLPEMVEQSTRVLVTWSQPYPEFNGWDLERIAEVLNCTIDEAIERLIPAGAIYFCMSEDDVRRIITYPSTMIGSDGIPYGAHPHPRLWGTFPRVLGSYARDLELMPLETAVHKMTGLAASTFGLNDRGLIVEGAFADIVLFDAERVADTATYEEPISPAIGIELVLVNGSIALDHGSMSETRAGHVVLREK